MKVEETFQQEIEDALIDIQVAPLQLICRATLIASLRRFFHSNLPKPSRQGESYITKEEQLMEFIKKTKS